MSKRSREEKPVLGQTKRPRIDRGVDDLAREYKDMKNKEDSIVKERKKKTHEADASVSALRRYLKWKKWVKEQQEELSRGVFGHLVRDEALCGKVLSAARSKDKTVDPVIQKLAGSYDYMCHKEKYETEAYDFHRYLKWKRWVKQQHEELSGGPLGHLVQDEELCEKVLAAARRLK